MRFFYLSLLLVVSTSLEAVTITWIGGSGNWNVAANWSTGTIPTAADEVLLGNDNKVIIPQNYDAFATNVDIGSGTLFTITDDASLTVIGTAPIAISNSGQFIHEGELTIEGDISNTIGFRNWETFSSTPQSVINIREVILGIDNIGDFQNGSNISIANASMYFSTGGIRNYSGANFRNNQYGDIDMADLEGSGIYNNFSTFTNEGRINFITDIGDTAIRNQGPFVNTGRVNFWTFESFGIDNVDLVTNSGTLYFSSGSSTNSAAFQNWYGSLINETTGIIDIENVNTNFGIYGNDANITNHGLIRIDLNTQVPIILLNNTSFENKSSGRILIKGSSDYGIRVTDSSFNNDGGKVIINKTAGMGLQLLDNGRIDNLNCGRINTSGRIKCVSGSHLYNEAWLEIGDINSPHTIFADFENYGLVYDPNATLTGLAIDNFGIIVDPLPAGVTEGQPVIDALWAGSQANNITVATTWTKGANGATLGTYDQNANIFTAINGSEGNIAVWAAFTIANCNSRIYAIEIPGGIQAASPLQDNPSLNLSSGQINSRDVGELSIFPNPILESFVVQVPADAPSSIELSFIQLDGKQLFRQSYKEVAGQQLQLTRPAHIPAGLYFLRLTSPDGWTSQSKIILK